MSVRAQGALEFLLILAGAVLIAAIVLSIIAGSGQQAGEDVNVRVDLARCQGFPEVECESIYYSDLDGDGDSDCQWADIGAGNYRCVPKMVSGLPPGPTEYWVSVSAVPALGKASTTNFNAKITCGCSGPACNNSAVMPIEIKINTTTVTGSCDLSSGFVSSNLGKFGFGFFHNLKVTNTDPINLPCTSSCTESDTFASFFPNKNFYWVSVDANPAVVVEGSGVTAEVYCGCIRNSGFCNWGSKTVDVKIGTTLVSTISCKLGLVTPTNVALGNAFTISSSPYTVNAVIKGGTCLNLTGYKCTDSDNFYVIPVNS